MNVNLQLHSDSLNTHALQKLTRQIYQEIKKDTSIQAALGEATLDEQIKGNVKGEAFNIGTIILTFITGGGAVALINVMKSYIDRGSRLEITLEKDGKKLTLNSSNTDSGQIDQTLKLMTQFFETEKHHDK